jgi:phosphoribosylformylglycinamidine cyclo-ligase
VFRWLFEAGQIKPKEMLRVFNCGIGMVLVVDAADTDVVTRHLSEHGETVYRIGELVPGDGPAKVHVDASDG